MTINASVRVLVIASLALPLTGSVSNAASNGERLIEFRNSIESNGCLNNNILTEICKGGRGLVETFEDATALSGAPVCVRFNATANSTSLKRLEGEFNARSGAYAEKILVGVDTSSLKGHSSLKKNDVVLVRGKLYENNSFYGNASDYCFIEFIGESIEIDGF